MERTRMKELTERYFPVSERYAGPVVHRSLIADAFKAGVAAVIEPLIDTNAHELDDEAIADAFEEWCEEEFTE